ncbi:MAG: gamma-glutamyl-gamma-aminobutyrate hydrolase family protein [Pseudonocardia sp.]
MGAAPAAPITLMNSREGPMSGHRLLTHADVMPDAEGARTGPAVYVLVSLDFPDMTTHTADFMRRSIRSALTALAERDLDWRLVDTSGPLPDPADSLGDAVLVLGGGDVDSELYGVAGPVPEEFGVDVRADRFTMDVLRTALAKDVPVLAVCRGAQLLNVALGGNLVPHLDDPLNLHRGDRSDGLFVDERVTVVPGSRLELLLGRRDWLVRAGHHQAVGDIAPQLRLAAVAKDGVVEAVEHLDKWAFGIQWHPEDDDGHGHDLALLWDALAEAALDR